MLLFNVLAGNAIVFDLDFPFLLNTGQKKQSNLHV